MAIDLDTVWHITYRDNSNADFTAASEDAARAASHTQHPDDPIVSMRQLTVADLFAGHDKNWRSASFLHPAFSVEGVWGESVALNFTTAITSEGVVDVQGIANYRYLRGIWEGLASVRVEGGRISMEILGAAPASAFDIIDNYIAFGDPIHQPTYEAVLVELGITDTRTVRVAYYNAHIGRWRMSVCPATQLDNRGLHRNLFPGFVEGQDLIVVDAVAGYPAGCATWAQYGGEALDIARAEHIGCQHQLFRPAY